MSATITVKGIFESARLLTSICMRCVYRVIACGALYLCVALSAPMTAIASAPTIKLSSASLADPTAAFHWYPTSTTHTTGAAALPTTAPEIVKLARSLGATRYSSDVYTQRVFDYVRLNIDTEFRFGLGKGARGALIDQSGTPFDQANLMVALLSQGGVTASYQIGPVVLNGTEFGLWSGLVYNVNQAAQTFTIHGRAACTLLADGGIPAIVNGVSSCTGTGTEMTGPLNTVTLLHIWVSANGKLYDPSYKRHILKAGVDLPSKMGCGSVVAPTCGPTVNTAGLVGSTTSTVGGAAAIQNINRSGINTQITSYATTLQGNIQTTDRFQQLEDVVGGALIDVTYSPTVGTSLPYASTQTAPLATWTGDIPDAFRTTLSVQFLGMTSPTLYLDELYGQRLRIGSLSPLNSWTRTSNLYVEGRVVATAQYNAVQGTQDIVTASINHPYAASNSGSTTLDGTYADEVVALYAGQDTRNASWQYVYPPSSTITDAYPTTITIVCALGRTGQGYQSLMTALQATGRKEIAIMGLGYPVPEQHPNEAAAILVQQTAADQALEGVTKSRFSVHHTLGVVYNIYRNETYSGMYNMNTMVSATNTSSVAIDRTAAFNTFALLNATLEGSVPQQIEDGWESISAVSVLWRANEDHQQFLSVNSSNFSGVSPSLSSNGYDATRLANISGLLSAGYQFLLPLKSQPPCAAITNGSICFPGGEITSKANELGYSIGERLKGNATLGQEDPVRSAMAAAQLAGYSLRDRHAYALNTSEGTIRLTPPPDLSVGMGDYPASLQFKRTYSSAETSQQSCNWYAVYPDVNLICEPVTEGTYQTILGNGWRHNFQISAEWTNNGLEAFALTSGLRASTTLAYMYTMFDLARGTSTSAQLAEVIVGYSMAASLMKNSIVFHLPEKTLTFVKLPDGSYDSPMNEPAAKVAISGTPVGPFLLGSTTVYLDYTPVTLRYTSSAGDIMNFSWNYQQTVAAGNLYAIARPTFDVQDWTTPAGVKVQFTYANYGSAISSQRRLTRVSNNLGHSLVINGGTAAPFITSVADETGRTVSFATSACTPSDYTSPLSLAEATLIQEDCRGTFSVTQPDQKVTSYSYMPDSASPDPTGTLQPTLRLRKWFTPSSAVTPYLTITYDEQMHVSGVVDALGNTTRAFTAAVTNEFDRMGEIQEPTGGGVPRTYYDKYSNPLIEIDALGRITTHSYDDARRLIRTMLPDQNGQKFQYDVRSNLLSTTRFAKPGSGWSDIPGPTTTYMEGPTVRTCSNNLTCNKPATVKDANNNITSYNWSGTTGQLLTMTGPPVTSGVTGNALTTFCYTSYATTNYDGSASTPLYLLTGRIGKVDGTHNRVTTYQYNTASKYVLSSATVDPNSTLTPPSSASLTCPTASATGLNLVTAFTFDPVGNVSSINGPRTDVTDTTNYRFDAMRRLTRVDAPLNSVIRYTYDYDGELITTRRARVASPTDSNPANPWPTDLDNTGAQWQTETRDYWSTGDLKSVKDAENNLTQYQIDALGRVTLLTDPDGRRTGTVYDLAGQTTCVFKGWDSATAPITADCAGWTPASYTDGTKRLRYTAYTYTPNGKQLSVQDADNNNTGSTYDGFDRLMFTLFADPASGVPCTVPTLITTTSTPTCSATQKYEQSTYDSNDNRLTLRTRNAQTITSTFDALNRLWTKAPTGLPTVTYGYNLLSEATSVASPAGGGIGAHSTTYAYDTAGRKLSETNDTRQVSYQYDAAGNRARTTWPDGYYVAYQYDALNRMLYARQNSTSAGEVGFYNYDLLSRRNYACFGGQSTTCSSGGGTNKTSYTYEPDSDLDVLTQVLSSTTVTLDFGRNHSHQITSLAASDDFYLARPAAAASTAYVPDRLNRYGSVGGQALTHDDNGNLLTWTPVGGGGKNTYTYDSENRLLTAAVNGSTTATITYEYDALGRRVKKTVGTTVTQYLLDGDEEIAELDVAGTVLRRYIVGSAIDDRIAQAEGSGISSPAPVYTYYHVDHHGSVMAMTDATGAATDRMSYDEYGNLYTGSTLGQQFRYTGRRFDVETGLYYYRARYYSPTLGRFLQVDPVGYKDDVNLYTYTGNDPLNETDPSGLSGSCAESSVGNPGVKCWEADSGASARFLNGSSGSSSRSAPATAQSQGSLFQSNNALDWNFFTTNGGPPTESALQGVDYLVTRLIGDFFDPQPTYTNGIRVDTGIAPVPLAAGRAAGALKGFGNIGSHGIVDAGTALSAGQRWLGSGYKEIAPGVFRSADALRQFRMTNADLVPTHGDIGSHVHFEALDEIGKVIENLHLPVGP